PQPPISTLFPYTTLFRSIMDKTSGTLLIDGKDVTTEKNAVRNTIGVVFQDSTLDHKMTVEENLNMHCVFYNLPKTIIEERIDLRSEEHTSELQSRENLVC